jgi:hypothetical protein
MSLRSLAIFRTTIPDDTIEDEVDIVQYGGRSVAEAIGSLLERQGFEAEPPAYLGVKGWDFMVRGWGQTYWLQVSWIDEIYLLVEHRRSWLGVFQSALARSDRQLGDFLRLLDAELRRDPRFSDLLWHPRKGGRANDQGGYPSPTD